MPCPRHVCGRVESVYNDMLQYPMYCGFDVITAAWMKDLGRSVDLCVRLLVPPSKQCAKTPLHQTNVLINVLGSLFGQDKKGGSITFAMKDFNFLP